MDAHALTLLRELADREALRDLMYRYGRAVDSVDLAGVLAVFDDPCSVLIQFGSPVPERHEGRAAVEAYFTARAAGNTHSRLIRHRYKNPLIELHGDSATASVYRDEIREVDNELIQCGGTYYETLRRTADGWRFQERVVKVAYRVKLVRDAAAAIRAGDLSLALP
jgi:ketosteroid isomerase-like protein